MMRIDAHHHVWALARGDYGWLTPELEPLYRDFGAEDLRPLMDRGGIDASILVQAAPTEAETLYLLDCADRHDWILGVVGWVDLDAAEAPERIAKLAAHPKLVGIRPMLQDMAERDWILGSQRDAALCALISHGLAFDALIRPDQIAVIDTLADRHPDLAIVIDHGAKPAIGADTTGWAAAMERLARRPNVHVKLSGLLTERTLGAGAEAVREVVDLLVAAFGPDRLLWGSDWPVLTLASGYAEWLALSQTLLADLAPSAREAVFGGNAARFYGLSRMNEPAVILLHPDDTVVVCVRPVAAGEHVRFDGGELIARQAIATGHKLAREAGGAGDKVIKYGASIGSLIRPVVPGDWIHLHNMKSDYIDPHTRAGLAHGIA